MPTTKLRERFPRTRRAICHAAPIANLTVMLDNSRVPADAFMLPRAQAGASVLFDCRDPAYKVSPEFREIAGLWLDKVERFSTRK